MMGAKIHEPSSAEIYLKVYIFQCYSLFGAKVSLFVTIVATAEVGK